MKSIWFAVALMASGAGGYAAAESVGRVAAPISLGDRVAPVVASPPALTPREKFSAAVAQFIQGCDESGERRAYDYGWFSYNRTKVFITCDQGDVLPALPGRAPSQNKT